MTAQARLGRCPGAARPPDSGVGLQPPTPAPRLCTKRVANPAHRTQRSVPSSRSSPTRAATPIPAPPMSSTASACPRRRLRSPSSRAPTCSSGWPPTACWTTSAPQQCRGRLRSSWPVGPTHSSLLSVLRTRGPRPSRCSDHGRDGGKVCESVRRQSQTCVLSSLLYKEKTTEHGRPCFIPLLPLVRH